MINDPDTREQIEWGQRYIHDYYGGPVNRPSIHQALTHVAYVMASRGTCPSIQVGCVIARDGRILTSGYNGAPAGMPHCTHAGRDSTSSGDPNVPTCLTAIHGEANAIAFAARHGVSLLDATMYTTLTPCRTCAQMIIQAGIREVYAAQEYRDPAGVNLLFDAGIPVAIMEGQL